VLTDEKEWHCLKRFSDQKLMMKSGWNSQSELELVLKAQVLVGLPLSPHPLQRRRLPCQLELEPHIVSSFLAPVLVQVLQALATPVCLAEIDEAFARSVDREFARPRGLQLAVSDFPFQPSLRYALHCRVKPLD